MMRDNLEDQEVFLEQNRRFHDLIAHGSGNVMFGYLVDSLLGILDGSAIGIDYPQFRRAAVHKAHLNIYEAIASRDPEASAEAMASTFTSTSATPRRSSPRCSTLLSCGALELPRCRAPQQ